MAVTVAAYGNVLAINTCEDYTEWTGETPANVTDFYKEGTQCVGFTVRDAAQADIYHDKATGSWSLSGKHLRLWFLTTATKELDSEANDGLQIILGDGTNTGYYTVLGGDTYPGGWYNIVLDCDRTPDGGTAPTLTAVTRVGLRFNTLAAAKNTQNTWIDMWHCCDGLSAYGDDAGGDFDLDDIVSADENTTNGWGVIRKIGGVYYLTGELRFGDTAGTSDCKFKDVNEMIVFEDRPVDSALYDIEVVNNATGTCNFQLGNIAGGKGIEGCVFKAEGTIKYTLTATDTDIDVFKLYGCTFIDSGAQYYPPNASGREVLSCNYTACGEIDPDTCVMKYCTISNADDRGLRIDTASHNVSLCNFISNPNGIHFAVSTTLSLDGCLFSGSNGSSLYDGEHSVSGTLTINAGEAENIQTNISASYIEETGGGSTTVNNTVYLTIDVFDEGAVAIENAQTAIYKTSDRTQLMNEDTLATGRAQESYNYPGSPVDIEVRVRKSSTGSTKYIPFSTTGQIDSGGYYLRVTLREDPNA